MPSPVTERPAICLNMIVRNEAHIIREVLNSVAPYISSWVIVDTGSDDGTQDLIINHMAQLGIRGDLYERPWQNFGHNRTEALTLAQHYGHYIWMMDADDVIVGTPNFTGLSADIYSMRCILESETIIWRAQLFRNGLPVRYEGAAHEVLMCDVPYTGTRLEGDYHIEARRLGARNLAGQQFARDRDLLLAEVERQPDNARSVFYLAQSYFDLGDFANARTWYARRVDMGGWDEEVYFSMTRIAVAMSKLGDPLPNVQDAFLRAWAFRPTRAEPLLHLAYLYRDGRYNQLGYLFAKLAAEIPFPEHDTLFVSASTYTWRATDEQAIYAARIGKHEEAFTLCRNLLARPDLADKDRQRIALNRDVSVPAMIEATSTYPDVTLVQRLVAYSRVHRQRGPRGAEVVVSLIAGPDLHTTELTLNSFLHCCTDASQAGRFLAVDAGLSAQDRALLQQRYGFLEFTEPSPTREPGALLAYLHTQLEGRFWLHLGQGWRFFAPENFIGRLMAVLQAEPTVFQVGINVNDAMNLTGTVAAEHEIRRTPDAGRYLVTAAAASGPAMFCTTRLKQAGGIDGTNAAPLTELTHRANAAGLKTASLDEVLCIAAH
ncbi:MAG: glycosyltransferase [Mycobacteriaceae bacterium]|nr:glycosyltransferase [Mycobacteriaceae bacterium]